MSNTLRIRQDGESVLLIKDGRLVATLPHQVACELSRALLRVGKLAEAEACRDQIIRDHAIVTRAGFPVGFTDDPKVQHEAAKLAAWGRDLRRYMPGGVKSTEHVGTPAVIRHTSRRP